MLDSKRVLIIAPHPDDETLGAGGTLLRLKADGAEIFWLLITCATAPTYSAKYIAEQERQINAVHTAYPFDGFEWLKIPASQVGAVGRPELVDGIRSTINNIKPETIFVPHCHDVHDDHRITFEASLAACKSFYMKDFGVRCIYAMDIPSETDAAAPLAGTRFLPTVTVDISSTLDDKLRIFDLYATERQLPNQPRSVDALRARAVADGAVCGVGAAEQFMLIRELIS